MTQTTESVKWFRNIQKEIDNSKKSDLRNVDISDGSPASVLNESKNKAINAESAIKNPNYKVRSPRSAFLGEMLSFTYFPKHVDKLPYYDTVPLIILFEKYQDGFLGMNIHYMPKNARRLLVEEVKRGRKKKIMGMLASLRTHKKRGFLWRRYLFSHIGSRIIGVPESEWDYVIELPVAFEGASHQQIYADYRKHW